MHVNHVLVSLAWILSTVAAYPNFYEKGSDVVPLKSTKDFKAQVTNSSFLWFLQAYRESCGFCKLFEAEFDKAAADLKHMVRFGAIDVEYHQKLASAVSSKYAFKVEGVPTVVMLLPGATVAQVYSGERKAKAVKAAATQAMPSFVDTVAPAKLDAWLEKVPRSSRAVVLFSAKPVVTPLLKAISSAYRGRINFAQLATDLKSEAGKTFAKRFDLLKLPTVVVLKRDADDLEDAKWLSEKFGGRSFASLTWADGEKPSFRKIEGWLMGYGRSPKKARPTSRKSKGDEL